MPFCLNSKVTKAWWTGNARDTEVINDGYQMFRTKTNYSECNLDQCNIGDWTNHMWRTGKLRVSWFNWDGASNVRAILSVWKHLSPVLGWFCPNVSPNVHEANQMRVTRLCSSPIQPSSWQILHAFPVLVQVSAGIIFANCTYSPAHI